MSVCAAVRPQTDRGHPTQYLALPVKYVTGRRQLLLYWSQSTDGREKPMVTKTDINAYRVAFATDTDWDAPMGRTLRLHMTLWSIFFALTVVGGLLS